MEPSPVDHIHRRASNSPNEDGPQLTLNDARFDILCSVRHDIESLKFQVRAGQMLNTPHQSKALSRARFSSIALEFWTCDGSQVLCGPCQKDGAHLARHDGRSSSV